MSAELATVTRCKKQTASATLTSRLMSRAKARTVVRGDQLRHRLEARGIVVRAGSMRDFAEETLWSEWLRVWELRSWLHDSNRWQL